MLRRAAAAAASSLAPAAVPHLPVAPLRSAAARHAAASASAPAGLPAALFSSGALDADAVVVTRSCAQRIKHLQGETPGLKLRISVDGGGCSGFQYVFELDGEAVGPDDCVFERDGAQVVIDESSLEFVKGATVDYVQEMIRSSFAIINNPNSESACGCGSSFALKAFEANPALD
mmetsp:Transcript_23718/g.49092  ORF Transcript_23718/g.49092 Transcript_23718/m.49092 type:complete len:175 (-) Transcript_23718:83-607(-)|eukprot:CAMPEP_0182531462 /NCGR_PEP_ID=MMETSP1323-20130603/9059_1 /TAXON_ID=236787 /ORGANISM="Florenciella parvula, Strain RCC1693" /LENGTH=174 /DNA_ID=CAMNT_0024741019 /DNA_START=31 /DNA_END=555 /DNA_ORIENTATION=+